MNKNVKSYDVNSMISKTFESFNDKDCSLWLPFYFKEKFTLKLLFCNLFIMIIVMLRSSTNQNNISSSNSIINMCTNSTTYIMISLDVKHHLLQLFKV